MVHIEIFVKIFTENLLYRIKFNPSVLAFDICSILDSVIATL